MNVEKPPPNPAAGRRRWRARLFEGALPEAYGLGIAAVFVLSLAGVLFLADYRLRIGGMALNQVRATELATICAAALTRSDDSTAADFDRVRNLEFVAAARWTDASGKLIRSWPAPAAAANDAAATTAGNAAFAAHLGTRATRARANAPDGGTLELACAFPSADLGRVTLLAAGGLAAVGGLGALALLYRAMRRHARPLAAVQHNLYAFANGLERELSALSLSDALGQVGSAWNQLLAHAIELRDAAQRAAAPERGMPLQRFESRALRQILDRLPVGVLRYGSNEIISYANPAALRLMETAGEDGLTGMSLEAVLGDDATLRQVRAMSESGSSTPVDRKLGESDAQRTLRFQSLPRGDSSGGQETVLTIDDISHLQEAERARDNFLYHVTHELRTPLTNIQAYVETLTRPGFDDENTRRECYNVIVSETRRLSRLIEDILSISQLEVGSAPIDLAEVDVVRLLREMVQDNLGHADEKKVELTLRLPPKAPKIRGDKQRLSVLINNLVGNAIKYTPSGGSATVALNVLDDRVEIEVADSGIGIAPDDQAHVFEKFYRADNEEVQQITGTGLGLAIAREVARLHGGDIRLKSEKGVGSTFTIDLPRIGVETQGAGVA